MNPIAVFDLETDPFEFGHIVEPFLSGYYDGSKFVTIWDEQLCIARSVAMLAKQEPKTIFIHNGGKFDIFVSDPGPAGKCLIDHFTGELTIINGRIGLATLGEHEVRDSFMIMPFPLADYKKDPIDYQKFRKSERNKHRQEITEYLRGDCVYLFELCSKFVELFGDKLTVGSAALTQLKKHHSFTRATVHFDQLFRKKYFHGGRNQCFETGIIEARLKLYDVNSMYPFVMATELHPCGTNASISDRIESDTIFLDVEGWNHGGLASRKPTGGLDFTSTYGTYHTTLAEYHAAMATNSFRTKRIHRTIGITNRTAFDSFVAFAFDSRALAKTCGDTSADLLWKYVANSAYGKFAQDPANYLDFTVTKIDDERPAEQCPHCKGLRICEQRGCFDCELLRDGAIRDDCEYCRRSGYKWTMAFQHDRYIVWSAQLLQHHYNNITVGASITGYARAHLLRGISNSTRPIYCDTDSLLCESMRAGPRTKLDNDQLGAWKVEVECDVAAICGKKLYALFVYDKPNLTDKQRRKNPDILNPVSFKGRTMYCVKKAHKGARLTGEQILRIAQGETIEYRNPVPGYKIDGRHKFIKRNIQRTAGININ